VTYSERTLLLEDRAPWTRSVQKWIEETGAGRKEISVDPRGVIRGEPKIKRRRLQLTFSQQIEEEARRKRKSQQIPKKADQNRTGEEKKT
jgi:hypothetical protein